jgi:hypothetical protein
MALRFLSRVGVLTREERQGIHIPEDPIAFADALRTLESALEERRSQDACHPSGGLCEFARRADRHLDEIGIVEDLRIMAGAAVRAVLLWPRAEVLTACQVAYRPFEELIPFASLE